ncbi:uncharacterized protein SPPG_08212 [Spizellomyces punctatus DAOM BR117]|uniref:L-ornithine N(5)-monooxygenase n=1 Tax=Spizellomyces punctatus (strain DAOM BR117) TaxID=645134 RepID=A0A0L0H5V9_SPIPD|nr:uncharacterized protein SPPG_08212 [Spizellomyces punctatus DAOM BR117]KNC96306.1 hypothetical protein SPPG_08212 [Spizellomyces punctatus DAOM BR117]|eukprot:XP_016604346.1 hypothetical protein SPPG_08212 [Spizellomyces punctatus DAOM BR117]
MQELLVIGAGPHALALLATLLESTPDKYLEHPENGLLFYRTRPDAGDSARTSHLLLARDTHYDSSRRPRKTDRDAVARVLNGLGARGARCSVHKKDRGMIDAHVDERVRGPGSLKTGLTGSGAGAGICPPVEWIKEHTLVLDKLGGTGYAGGKECRKLGTWMSLWRKQMEFLRVPHLRSPISHHPDPIDRSILWQYAMAKRRTSDADLVPLHILRDRSYTGPFILPSTELFWSFCADSLVNGFGIRDLVQSGEAVDIVPVPCGCSVDDNQDLSNEQNAQSKFCDHFRVEFKDGRLVNARNVVVAVGSSSCERNIPAWVKTLPPGYPKHCLCHCFDIALDDATYLKSFSSAKKGPLRHKSVVIIGGGITSSLIDLTPMFVANKNSIHVSRTALDLGCNSVVLLSRSKLRIQPFDVDVRWVGPHRSTNIAQFWSDNEYQSRAHRLRLARFPPKADEAYSGSGATITHEAMELVRDDLASGKMSVTQEVEVISAKWYEEVPQHGKWELLLSNGSTIACNIIWLATGTRNTVSTNTLLHTVAKHYPIPIQNGLPSLREDLSWSRNCPGLFVMGSLAALQVGRGAPNLMGGRAAAGRISRSLIERLRKAYRAGQ